VNLLKNSKVSVVAVAVATSVGVAAVSAASSSAAVSPRSSTVSAASFTNNFSAMKALKSVSAAGTGSIDEILPDTTSSTRYTEFDTPDFNKAAAAAGLPSSDYKSQNAGGSDSTFITDAKADITAGAKVLLIDPEDSGTGIQVENYAASHGVKVIDYDRLDIGSNAPADPYVSFNNVEVGTLIGKGFVSCAASWLKGQTPNVIVMHGSPTDNNATLFSEGYMGVLDPLFKSGKYKEAANTAGTWNPTSPSPDALDEFKSAYTAHPTANSALIPNDENGAPIITYLQSKGVKPDTFPTTGQDATLTGLDNILSGYQCGTVYKAVYKEAQAAVALAIYYRAGKTPPTGLLNGTTTDPTNHKKVPSVLLSPVWVTPQNMKSTIIADNFVPKSQLCAGTYAKDCTKYGI
jgi:D-xylose transport system substrate-binding protein